MGIMVKSADPLGFSPSQEMSRPLLELRYCMDQTAPRVSLHAHVFYEFYIFVGGDLDRYVIGQKNYQLEPGDILVIPPMVLHHPVFRQNSSQPYRRYFFWVSREYIESLEHYPMSDYFLRCCAEQDEFLIHPSELQRRQILKLLENSWDDITTQQICNDLYLQANCLRFIAKANNFIMSGGGQLKSLSNQRNDMMEEVLAYIHDNFSGKLTLLSTAARFHVSMSTLENMFNQIIGKPFYSYVIEYRIITAQAMILDGVPLQEASRACGYPDYSNFFKVFSKRVGCSPSGFRRAAQPPDTLRA